jgi:hypothetical protein
MIDKNQNVEKIVFEELIQSEVEFYTLSETGEKNVIKTGRILNFNIKLPFLYFVLEYKDKSREYPLPQPFAYKFKDDKLIFSYKLENSSTNKKVIDKMGKLAYDSESKLLNKILYIEPV